MKGDCTNSQRRLSSFPHAYAWPLVTVAKTRPLSIGCLSYLAAEFQMYSRVEFYFFFNNAISSPIKTCYSDKKNSDARNQYFFPAHPPPPKKTEIFVKVHSWFWQGKISKLHSLRRPCVYPAVLCGSILNETVTCLHLTYMSNRVNS